MEITGIAIVLSLLVTCRAASWGYGTDDGPSKWVIKGYPTCGNTNQSPIDIQKTSATESSTLTNFEFAGYHSVPAGASWSVGNNGHTVTVGIDAGTYTISGGGLSSSYTLAQYHFHWGSDSTKGSEHTMDGKQYPMEVHFVHYKTSLGSLGAAVNVTPDGLAVLGFFFEIQADDNTALNPILEKLASVKHKDNSSSVTPFILQNMLPQDKSIFYRYNGSLTTPGCFESVQWTVFENTIKISESQLSKLRTEVMDEKGSAVVNNYRPPQHLHGRTVLKPTSGASNLMLPIPVVIATVLLSIFEGNGKPV